MDSHVQATMVSAKGSLREALICAQTPSGTHYLLKIFFSQRDTSLYVIPASTSKSFFFGRQQYPAGADSFTWRFRDGQYSRIAPKLSWHQSGVVRITARELVSEPIQRVGLAKLRGEHIASVSIADFTRFPPYARRLNKSQHCIELPIPPGDDTLTFAIYAAHNAQHLPADRLIIFGLLRPGCSAEMYFGVRVRHGGFPFEASSPMLLSSWDLQARTAGLETMAFLCISE